MYNRFVVSRIIATWFSSLFFLSPVFANNDPTYITGPEVDNFITYMSEKHNLDEIDLGNFLYNAKYQPDVIKAIQKPAEKLPWHRYETIFLTNNRINGGVKFWQENSATLKRASEQYGVPPEIIVALIGVETFYGNNKGKYPVLDTLATLAFHYKPRSPFFTSELEQFLLYTHEENADPRDYLGSYAGAMGYPQFISSSIRNYAVDFSNSGSRDLHNSIPNAIGSVANYLNKYGWQKDQPIVTNINLAQMPKKNYEEVAKHINTVKPAITVKQLKKLGLQIPNKYGNNLDTSVLAFEEANGKKYKLGFQNFYVITRYNNSQNYALAVYLLSEKIKKEYKDSEVAMQARKV